MDFYDSLIVLISIEASLFVSICGQPQAVTVLVILDGFRHDYLDKFKESTPYLRELANTGVLVPDIEPVFPSSRLPNMVSMLTGQYTEMHNVIDSEIYDSQEQKRVTVESKEFWQSSIKIGTIWDAHMNMKRKKRLNRIIGFPEKRFFFADAFDTDGAENNGTIAKNERASEEEKQATHMSIVNHQEDWDESFLAEFQKSLEDFNVTGAQAFITMFIDEPGLSAKVNGPDQVGSVVKKVDTFLGELLKAIQSGGFEDFTNFVIVSTPGYTDIRPAGLISLRKAISNDRVQFVGHSPVFNLIFPNGTVNDDDQKVQTDILDTYFELEESGKNGEFKAYGKRKIPDEWRYANSKYVQPLTVLASPNVAFTEDFKDTIKSYDRPVGMDNVYGINGYEPSLIDMHTLAVLKGPAFPVNKGRLASNETRNVTTVDLFVLVCKTLDIDHDECIGRQGSLSAVSNLFQDSDKNVISQHISDIIEYASTPEHLPMTVTIAIISLLFVLLLLCIGIVRRRQRIKSGRQGFRYSQVRHNRRLEDADGNSIDEFRDEEDEDLEDQRQLLAETKAAEAKSETENYYADA